MKRALAFLSGALVVLACARAGHSAESGPAGRQVELTVGAATPDAALLESSVRELLEAKRLGVVATRKPSVTAQDVAIAIAPPQEAVPSVARILVDLTGPRQATLFLVDPRRGRVFVRRLPLPHGLDAVARASLRFVVEQSIDAILEGRDIGVSREEFQRSVSPPVPAVEPPRPPPATPAPPAPAPAGPHWSLAGGYEVVALGSGQFQQAGRVAVTARFARLQIAAAARFAAPISVAGDGAGARLETAGASLSTAARLLVSGGWSLAAGLGADLDLIRVQPSVTTTGLQPVAAFWATSPALQPFATLAWKFDAISVAVCAGAEIHPLAERYTVESGGQTRDVFVPWRLRPTGALLIGVEF